MEISQKHQGSLKYTKMLLVRKFKGHNFEELENHVWKKNST